MKPLKVTKEKWRKQLNEIMLEYGYEDAIEAVEKFVRSTIQAEKEELLGRIDSVINEEYANLFDPKELDNTKQIG